MEIKKGLDVCTGDFWYDLTNGYIEPVDICAKPEDAEKVNKAIGIIQEFQDSCESEIPGFIQ